MLSRVPKGASRARSDESGATAVEFALIAAIFITLLMGIIEFSLILFTYTSASSASRDVARRIATSRLTIAEASAAAKAGLPNWVRTWTTVTVAQTTPATPSTNQITVTVSFPASKATPTTYLSFAYGSLTLDTSTTMQQEI
jgi:Flp pilus assembly protein TadG